MGRVLVGLLGLLPVPGCSINTPEPFPLRGEAPTTVLVAPIAGPVGVDAARALWVTADAALRGRGYYAIPVEVGQSMLASFGLAEFRTRPAVEWARVARAIGADAFLTIRVEVWDARFAPNLVWLSYDVGYRLWSSKDGTLLWEVRAKDGFSWDPTTRAFDHDRSFDEFLGVEPGRSESPYQDNLDAAWSMQQWVFESLPPAAQKRKGS